MMTSLRDIYKPGRIVELKEMPPESAIGMDFDAAVGGHYQVRDIMGCCLYVQDMERGGTSILNHERFHLAPSALVPTCAMI